MASHVSLIPGQSPLHTRSHLLHQDDQLPPCFFHLLQHEVAAVEAQRSHLLGWASLGDVVALHHKLAVVVAAPCLCQYQSASCPRLFEEGTLMKPGLVVGSQGKAVNQPAGSEGVPSLAAASEEVRSTFAAHAARLRGAWHFYASIHDHRCCPGHKDLGILRMLLVDG